jgi:hypothetical protein
MDKGILSYPLNPFFENVVNLGRTSISTKEIWSEISALQHSQQFGQHTMLRNAPLSS